jgi:membrane associated rhomboid family serine protease
MVKGNGVIVNRLKYEFKTKPVTCSIILICVVVWLLQLLTNDYITQLLIFNPIIAAKQPYRFVTSIFLHSTAQLAPGIPSPFHIGFNMYSLYVVGPFLERYYSKWKYLALYLLSGIAGSVFISLWTVIFGGENYLISTLGASGAIFGLFVALIMSLKKFGVNINSMLIVLAINLAIPFFILGIAWQAHIGGAFVGLLLSYFAKRYWVFSGAIFAVLLAVGVFSSVYLLSLFHLSF